MKVGQEASMAAKKRPRSVQSGPRSASMADSSVEIVEKCPSAKRRREVQTQHSINISTVSGEIVIKHPAGVFRCNEILSSLRDRMRFPEHVLKLVGPAGNILDADEYLRHHTSVVVDWAAFARRLEEMELRVASGNCDEFCACCGDQREGVHERFVGVEAWFTTVCRMCYWSMPLCTDCMIYDIHGAAWHCAQCLWSYRAGSNADVDRNPADPHFLRYVKPSVGHWESLPQRVREWCQNLDKLRSVYANDDGDPCSTATLLVGELSRKGSHDQMEMDIVQ